MNKNNFVIDGAVILTRNRPSFAYRCIDSIKTNFPSLYPNIVVIDDSSPLQKKISLKLLQGISLVNKESWRNDIKWEDEFHLRGKKLDLGLNGWNTPNARNIAQLVVKKLGWNTVLYLDDDVVISNVNTSALDDLILQNGIRLIPLAGCPDFSYLDWIELWVQLHIGKGRILESIGSNVAKIYISQFTNLSISHQLFSNQVHNCTPHTGLGACFIASGENPLGFFPRIYDEDLYLFNKYEFHNLTTPSPLNAQHLPPPKNILSPTIIFQQTLDNIICRTMLVGRDKSKKSRIRYCKRLHRQALTKVERLLKEFELNKFNDCLIQRTLHSYKEHLDIYIVDDLEFLAEQELLNERKWDKYYGRLV